jgi:5-methylcytosine-specific restriction endonuclease McrA
VIDPARLQELLDHVATLPRHEQHDPLIRQIARLRARDACEYCLHPTTGQYQIDHLIPRTRWPEYLTGQLPDMNLPPGRHGPDHLDNYGWCCPFCNGSKQDRLAFRIGELSVRIFDPRRDRWPEHFTFVNHYLFIIGITPVGVATQRLLGFNAGDIHGPLGTRHDSIVGGRYPPRWLRTGGASDATEHAVDDDGWA